MAKERPNVNIPDIVLDKNRTRILGTYLAMIASFQIYIYVQINAGMDILFYFDPRIGILAFREVLSHQTTEKLTVPLVEWLSAAWIGGIALLMVLGKNTIVKVYIISEMILFLPNLLFAVFVVYFNVRPVTGFSIRELFCPLLVMLYTTIVPFLLISMRAKIVQKST